MYNNKTLLRYIKTILICMITLTILLIGVVESYAAAPLTLSVNAGFAGKCKLGGINPVQVTLESEGEELEGVLKVEIGDKIYSHPVALPAGTKKLFSFSISIQEVKRELKVSFIKGSEVIASRQIPLELLPANSIFIGLLSENPEELNYVKEIKPFLQHDREVAAVSLDDLDYTQSEMENFNFILLDNFNTAGLDQAKQLLLQNWVAQRGFVLVGTGQYRHKTLSGSFAGLSEAKRLGSGCIITFPGNLGSSDNLVLVKKAVEQYITPRGLNRIINGNDLQDQSQTAEKLQPVADHLFKPTYNSVFFLLAMLIVYLILLGAAGFPGKRFRWAVPVIIAGFSMIFYILAWSGGLHKSKAVSAGVQIYQNGITSYSLTNIYPYKQQHMQVQLPGITFIDELGSGSYSYDPLEQQITYYNEEPHYLYSRQFTECENPSLQLSLDGDLLTGEIINPLVSELSNCFLLLGDTLINFGELEGRERVQVKYRLDHKLRNLGDYNYLASVYEAGQMNNYLRELINYYFQVADRDPVCKIFGFSTEKRDVSIDGKTREIEQLNLHVFLVQLKNSPESVNLPPGFLKPVVCGNNQTAGSKNEYTLREGEALVAYYVLPPEVKAREISVYTSVEGGKADLEVYNYRQASWDPLVSGVLKEDSLEFYTGSGPLTIKVKGSGRVIIPQIMVLGYKNSGGEKVAGS